MNGQQNGAGAGAEERALFPSPSVEAAVAAIDAEIEAALEVLARIEAERDTHRANVARLNRAKATLTRTATTDRRGHSAARRAGAGNVQAAKVVLSRAGKLAKAEIGRRMAVERGVEHVNDGTVTYAVRALVDEGLARKTGEKVVGSDVYEYLPAFRRPRRVVSRPGDR